MIQGEREAWTAMVDGSFTEAPGSLLSRRSLLQMVVVGAALTVIGGLIVGYELTAKPIPRLVAYVGGVPLGIGLSLLAFRGLLSIKPVFNYYERVLITEPRPAHRRTPRRVF